MGNTPSDAPVVDTNLVAQHLAIQSVVVVLAITFVVLRLYVRLKIIKSTGRDDWVMAGAAVCSITTWALYIYKGFHGLGHHSPAFVTTEDQSKFGEAAFWQVIISSCLGIALLKISIALTLLRLSPSRWYTWSLYFSIVFVSAYSFMGAMTFFLHCKPMQASWDHSIAGSTCYSIKLFIKFGLINTGFNVFTDILFATLPIPIIWNLQVKHRVRLYLIGVLSLGYAACAFGVTNAIYQIRFDGKDATFKDANLFYAVLQVNVGMIAACAPSLKPLVSKALKLSEYATHANTGSHFGSQFASRSRTRPWNDQYALEELQSCDEGKRSDEVRMTDRAPNYSASAAFYNAEENSSHSDEMIRPQKNDLKNGGRNIVMTTEVIVH